MTPKTVTLAMTGASGAEYTLRLFECCLQNNIRVQFITSQPGQIVAGMETELKLTGSPQKMKQQLVSYFNADPDLIEIALGCFDSELPIKPDAHIFVASGANWAKPDDKLPQYEAGRDSKRIR